jgi:hypothetical protein
MASEVEKVDATVLINQTYLSTPTANNVGKGESSTVISNVSLAPVDLDELQWDVSELIHILHATERSSVKEIIQADIQSLLAKMENIED